MTHLLIKFMLFPLLLIPITPWIVTYLNRKKHRKALKETRDKYNDDIYQYKVIFVTQPGTGNCRYHLYKRTPCGSECSFEYLEKIISFVLSAKSSISIMMYHLTIESLTDTIIECATVRKIKVRCICDQVMGKSEASKYRFLVENGIEVRTPNQNVGLMHHKVILADSDLPKNRGKVLSGSMNMTIQALTQNWDMFVMTNNKDTVGRFHEEFEYLWEQFIPLNEMIKFKR